MSFDTFLQQAWADHAQDSSAVAARLPEGIALLEKPEQVAPLARLVVHVVGEHLGDWSLGLSLLESLRQSPHFSPDAQSALTRSEVILGVSRGDPFPAGLSKSERVRVQATSAGCLSARGESERAEKLFREALELARHLDKSDPAQRDLAVASNNLACLLEEKSDRHFRESELMLIAAHASRRHWEMAGGWLEMMRAEYRLAMSFLQAGKPSDALRHAELCREIGEQNEAPASERLFAFEAIALSLLGAGNLPASAEAVASALECFEKVPENERTWCEAAVQKLRGL